MVTNDAFRGNTNSFNTNTLIDAEGKFHAAHLWRKIQCRYRAESMELAKARQSSPERGRTAKFRRNPLKADPVSAFIRRTVKRPIFGLGARGFSSIIRAARTQADQGPRIGSTSS